MSSVRSEDKAKITRPGKKITQSIFRCGFSIQNNDPNQFEIGPKRLEWRATYKTFNIKALD